MNMNPQISIIVPVYNTAEYLERCIGSIIKQDFTEWELLLIDDGSTDNSLFICKKIEAKDCRIKVFSQNNSGVSAARNKGLNEALGQYICFIDSDDYIEPNYLSSLYKYREYDLVICGYYVDLYSDNLTLKKQEKHIPTHLDLKLIKNKINLKDLFLSGMMNSNWNKLYKARIINNNHLKFKPYPINEDNIFTLEYIMHISSIYTTQDLLYHWIRIDNRLTGVDSIPSNIVEIYNEAHLLTRSFLQNNLIADQIFYYSYQLIILKYFSSINLGKEKRQSVFAQINNIHKNPLIKSSYKAYQSNNLTNRFICFLQRWGFFKTYFYINNYLNK